MGIPVIPPQSEGVFACFFGGQVVSMATILDISNCTYVMKIWRKFRIWLSEFNRYFQLISTLDCLLGLQGDTRLSCEDEWNTRSWRRKLSLEMPFEAILGSCRQVWHFQRAKRSRHHLASMDVQVDVEIGWPCSQSVFWWTAEATSVLKKTIPGSLTCYVTCKPLVASGNCLCRVIVC